MCDLLVGHWKDEYLAKKKQLDEKMARVGKKVRGMWESEERKKQLRSIQASILNRLQCDIAYTSTRQHLHAVNPDCKDHSYRQKSILTIH